jgi:hypothetical protein
LLANEGEKERRSEARGRGRGKSNDNGCGQSSGSLGIIVGHGWKEREGASQWRGGAMGEEVAGNHCCSIDGSSVYIRSYMTFQLHDSSIVETLGYTNSRLFTF